MGSLPTERNPPTNNSKYTLGSSSALTHQSRFKMKFVLTLVLIGLVATVFGGSCIPEYAIQYYGHDLGGNPRTNVNAWEQCARMCRDHFACFYWTWRIGSRKCYLKTSNAGRRTINDAVSGSKICIKSSYC